MSHDRSIPMLNDISALSLASVGDKIQQRSVTGRHACAIVEIDNFTFEEAKELMGDMMGVHLGGVPDAPVKYVMAHTEGHPLYAAHLVDHLCDSNFLKVSKGVLQFEPPPASSNEIPRSLEALFVRMVDTLDHTVQEVLKIGAIMGRTFNQELLFHICARHLPKGFSLNHLDVVLGMLVDVGVLTTVTMSQRSIITDYSLATHRFRQETLRKGLCSMIIDNFQKRIHADIATAIEDALQSQTRRMLRTDEISRTTSRVQDGNDDDQDSHTSNNINANINNTSITTLSEQDQARPSSVKPVLHRAKGASFYRDRRGDAMYHMQVHHWLNAGEPSKAYRVAEQAGEHAFTIYDNARAINLFQTALSAVCLWEDCVPSRAVLESHLQQRIGELMWRIGRRDLCFEHSNRVLQIFSTKLPSARNAASAIKAASHYFREQSRRQFPPVKQPLLSRFSRVFMSRSMSKSGSPHTMPMELNPSVLCKALRLLCDCAWSDCNIDDTMQLTAVLWQVSFEYRLNDMTSSWWVHVCGMVSCLMACMNDFENALLAVSCIETLINQKDDRLTTLGFLERSHIAYCEGFVRIRMGDLPAGVDKLFESGACVRNSIQTDRAELAQLHTAWVLQTQGDFIGCIRLVLALRHAAQSRSSRDIMAQCDFFLCTCYLMLGQISKAEISARSIQDLNASISCQIVLGHNVLLEFCEAMKCFLEGGTQPIQEARRRVLSLAQILSKAKPKTITDFRLGVLYQLLGIIAFGVDVRDLPDNQPTPLLPSLSIIKKATVQNTRNRRGSLMSLTVYNAGKQSRDMSFSSISTATQMMKETSQRLGNSLPMTHLPSPHLFDQPSNYHTLTSVATDPLNGKSSRKMIMLPTDTQAIFGLFTRKSPPKALTRLDHKLQSTFSEAIEKYAAIFPHLKPVLHRTAATQLFAKGQADKAQSMWMRSLQLAKSLRLQFDLACCFAELSRHGEPVLVQLNMEKWRILIETLSCPCAFTQSYV
eukprot:c15330_g1_i1.p1 GENE.c15330_g1_i1~~c15330_g1_i1.p1  ORF type:complete len:1163 (-),score=290.10 c15330_g1_i1:328-3300(-)